MPASDRGGLSTPELPLENILLIMTSLDSISVFGNIVLDVTSLHLCQRQHSFPYFVALFLVGD